MKGWKKSEFFQRRKKQRLVGYRKNYSEKWKMKKRVTIIETYNFFWDIQLMSATQANLYHLLNTCRCC